jgi:hypothetical protein
LTDSINPNRGNHVDQAGISDLLRRGRINTIAHAPQPRSVRLFSFLAFRRRPTDFRWNLRISHSSVPEAGAGEVLSLTSTQTSEEGNRRCFRPQKPGHRHHVCRWRNWHCGIRMVSIQSMGNVGISPRQPRRETSRIRFLAKGIGMEQKSFITSLNKATKHQLLAVLSNEVLMWLRQRLIEECGPHVHGQSTPSSICVEVDQEGEPVNWRTCQLEKPMREHA